MPDLTAQSATGTTIVRRPRLQAFRVHLRRLFLGRREVVPGDRGRRLSGWPVVVPCGADTTATHTIRLSAGNSGSWCPAPPQELTGAQFTSMTSGISWSAGVSTTRYLRSITPSLLATPRRPFKFSQNTSFLRRRPPGNIDSEDFDPGSPGARTLKTSRDDSPSNEMYGQPLALVPVHPESFSEEMAGPHRGL
ncbi:hypothetical protein GWK47_044118 [Chionoecetes opilio]|uniref:Uncharacterized protein n=1 Tax=Chionoecetes opilio TaxID=41210 RepID=A0A8J4YGW0_CHIOP|nr:hypothetical protein GWK47_044118 [Chionoecetes opilio]